MALSRRASLRAFALGATLVVAPSCGGGAARTVAVTERDFSISLAPTEAAEGTVTFRISNRGPSTHEFVVVAGFHAVDALPVKDGVINEAAEGVDVLDEQEDIGLGTTVMLSVALTPGSYILICNLPGHYQKGMRTRLNVRPS